MNLNQNLPEVWLRGLLPAVPPMLQPAAHALLQTAEELKVILDGVSNEILFQKLGARATISFHLKHMTGVLDRMMTYAKGRQLGKSQFEYLQNEGIDNANDTISGLIIAFDTKIEEALDYFGTLKDNDLTQYRGVGRKQLPSTVIGLLFHSAEHAQRHLGQLLVTVHALNILHPAFQKENKVNLGLR